MYEQLIANLRAVDEYDTGYAKLIWEAADAIEDLSKAEKVTVKMPQGKSIPITKKLVENINACTERRIRSEKSKGEKQ